MSTESLEIRLLGELEVVRGGRAVALPASKKTRALLGYLCATGRAHLRERLCDLLWEGPDDPRAALRWSLTKIRPLLDTARATRLRADRERVAFDPAGAVVDLADVRQRVRPPATGTSVADLQAAAARFRGPFLDGLELPACHGYHAWWVGEREQLRSLHVSLRLELMQRLRGEPEEALRHARALLSLDPLAESSHIAVVRLLAETGRTRDALEQYERCRYILQTELGARPSAEMEQVRMSLGQRSSSGPGPGPTALPVSPSRPQPSPPGAHPGLPLIGRGDERDAMAAAVASARTGRASEVLLVLGDPGVGKTRLLEDLQERTLAAGGAVLGGRAFEAELVRPYGAWIDALRPVSGRVGPALRDDLTPLLPELGAAPASTDRARLYDAVARLIRDLAVATAPVAVVLDDIQWLDEASAALLHFLARALARAPTLLACAARGGELGDNQAVLRLVRALDRDRRLRQIALGPLDAGGTLELVRAAEPGVDGARVFSESEGNPLFALEIARSLRADGAEPSRTLDALLGERLSHLDEPTRALLPWAAALGRSFDPEVLGRVSGLPVATLVAALDDLERHGLVRSAGAGYDFAHDLVRRAAYRRMSEPRRRLVHLQIARALSAGGDPDGIVAGDIAHHAGLGGDDRLSARACVAAGQRCLRLFAHAEAAEVVGRGLIHAERLSRAERVSIGIALLGVQVMNPAVRARARDLDTQLTRMIVDARDTGLPAEVVRGLHLKSVLQFERGDFGGAHQSTLRAVEVVPGGDPMQAALNAARAARCLVMIEKDLPRARAMLEEAEKMAGPRASDMLDVVWGLGMLHHHTGDERAVADLERSLALVRSAGRHWEECDCLMRLTIIELEAGRARDARKRSAELVEVAAKMGEGSEQPVAAALDALSRQAAGEGDAQPAVEAAIEALRKIDAKGLLALVLTLAAEMDLAAGRSDAAGRRAAEALAAANAVERRSQTALARVVLARVALGAGDARGAADQIQPALRDVGEPLAISARAAAAVVETASALGLRRPSDRA